MKATVWLWLCGLVFAAAVSNYAAELDKPPAFELSGKWECTIEVGKFNMRLLVTLARSAEGRVSGKIDIPDQGAKDIPISAILFNDPAVRFEIDPFDNTAFNGRINRDGNEITGQFEEGPGGRPIAAVFRRAPEIPGENQEWVYTFAKDEVHDLRGYWKGDVEDPPGTTAPIGLKIGRRANGKFQALLALLDRGVQDAAASKVQNSNSVVKLEWQMFHITFDGALADNANQLAGMWQQNGKSIPVSFERLAQPATALPSDVSFIPENTEDARGYWKGTLEVRGQRLRLVFKIGRTPAGVLAGSLASLDQGGTELPMTRGGITNSVVKLEWTPIHGVFKGALNQEGTILDGTWEQMGPPLTLKLERMAPPSESKAP